MVPYLPATMSDIPHSTVKTNHGGLRARRWEDEITGSSSAMADHPEIEDSPAKSQSRDEELLARLAYTQGITMVFHIQRFQELTTKSHVRAKPWDRLV